MYPYVVVNSHARETRGTGCYGMKARAELAESKRPLRVGDSHTNSKALHGLLFMQPEKRDLRAGKGITVEIQYLTFEAVRPPIEWNLEGPSFPEFHRDSAYLHMGSRMSGEAEFADRDVIHGKVAAGITRHRVRALCVGVKTT